MKKLFLFVVLFFCLNITNLFSQEIKPDTIYIDASYCCDTTHFVCDTISVLYVPDTIWVTLSDSIKNNYVSQDCWGRIYKVLPGCPVCGCPDIFEPENSIDYILYQKKICICKRCRTFYLER
jgi:hypothetical protein